MGFILDSRKQFLEVDSVDELESMIPEIIIESANYCANEEQPFTPTYVYLNKDEMTVHFLLEFNSMVLFFDILKRSKTIDCAAIPLRKFMSGEHIIACEHIAHLICNMFRDTIQLENVRIGTIR